MPGNSVPEGRVRLYCCVIRIDTFSSDFARALNLIADRENARVELSGRRRAAGVVAVVLTCIGSVLAGPSDAATADLRVPPGRFEFAPVPEHAFVAGLPETVQLGIWQLDPANPWPAGDQTRSAGWTSRFPTRLVDSGTGKAVSGLEYDGRTGELRYAGDGARDLSVRLERTDAPIASNTFRIRVLTPTHVYGEGAATANREHRWGAKVCEPPMTFAACRKGFKGTGMGDASPLVVHLTPGSYEGDFFLGKQRFVYVLGDPQNWPQLNRDSLDVAPFRAGDVSQPRAQFDADRPARSAR